MVKETLPEDAVRPFKVLVNVTVSPSSTCKPAQAVSRSPPVPQLAGVPPQSPVAAMVTVCAAVGMDANAASTKTMAAVPPEVRERRLPRPPRAHGGEFSHSHRLNRAHRLRGQLRRAA